MGIMDKEFFDRFYCLLSAVVIAILFLLTPASAAEKQDDTLKQLNELQERLELQTRRARQLEALIAGELKLSIIRRRNLLRSELLNASMLSNSELGNRIQHALSVAVFAGDDHTHITRIFNAARNIILNADFTAVGLDDTEADLTVTQKLSALLETAVREEEKAAHARARVQEYKSIMYRRLAENYMECLLARDLSESAEKLRAYTEAIRKIQSGDSDALAAQADMIRATHEAASLLLSGVPLVGDAIDWVALINGEDPISGEHLEGLYWVLTAAVTAIEPLQLVIKASPAAKNWLLQFAEGAGRAPEKLGKAVGRDADEVISVGRRIDEILETNTSSSSARSASVTSAVKESATSVKGNAYISQSQIDSAERIWKEANINAEKALEELASKIKSENVNDLLRDREFLTQYQKVRSDPRAVSALKKGSEELRNRIFDMEARLFGIVEESGRPIIGTVDRAAITNIRRDIASALNSPALEASSYTGSGTFKLQQKLKELALKEQIPLNKLIDVSEPAEWDILVYNASNTPPARGTIGSDRDITYILRLKTGHHVEIPAEVVRPRYAESLYRHLNPGKPVPKASELQSWLTRMDHSVVDGMQLEAYSLRGSNSRKYYKMDHETFTLTEETMDMNIKEFLKEGSAARPGGVVAEGLSDTINFKGDEWYHRASSAYNDGDMARGMALEAEGMRQISKQFKNLIKDEAARQSLHISPQIMGTLQVFQDVEKGLISPIAAKAKLVQITGGLPPDEALQTMSRRISDLYESLHKMGGLK